MAATLIRRKGHAERPPFPQVNIASSKLRRAPRALKAIKRRERHAVRRRDPKRVPARDRQRCRDGMEVGPAARWY